jgi:hypothetical protein
MKRSRIINTGTFGSEGTKPVRTNMGIAKDGGELIMQDLGITTSQAYNRIFFR